MLKNKLMQLFKENDSPRNKKIKAETDSDSATIYIYDAVGDWYGISSKDFIQELAGIQENKIHLRINSPGGDVFEARAIQVALQQCGKEVTAHIDGVCASAATGIALACKTVEMAQGSFFMIHNAWTLAMGNAKDLHDTADMLEKVDDAIVNDYCKKTGKKSEEIKKMMDEETWMNADEALANGFVDSVYDGEPVENKWNLSAYENVPEKLAKTTEKVYDREKFEKRLQLIEANA